MPAVSPLTRSRAARAALTLPLSLGIATAGLAPVAAHAATTPTASHVTATRLRGTVSAGRVVGLTAHVADNAGRPLAGQRVWEYSYDYAHGHWLYLHSFVTNAAGNIRAVHRLTANAALYYRNVGTPTHATSRSPIIKIGVRPATTNLGTRAVAEASRYRGAPYQWGAVGPTRFDCSGLTDYVFGRLGHRLPRTAASQYGALRHVSAAAKQAGDLVFFHDGGGYIYHVGIYAGRNQMWAATKPGDVVRLETIWTSSYYVGRVSG